MAMASASEPAFCSTPSVHGERGLLGAGVWVHRAHRGHRGCRHRGGGYRWIAADGRPRWGGGDGGGSASVCHACGTASATETLPSAMCQFCQDEPFHHGGCRPAWAQNSQPLPSAVQRPAAPVATLTAAALQASSTGGGGASVQRPAAPAAVAALVAAVPAALVGTLTAAALQEQAAGCWRALARRGSRQ